jgi:hypothetical protein
MCLARWILASGLILAAAPLFAQTVAVGTCQPNKTSFPKIQQALNATPPGATIDVCPGLYPEQILVYQASCHRPDYVNSPLRACSPFP